MSSEIDFQAIFHASPNPYALLAPDLTLLDVNDAYLQAFALARAEAVGRRLNDLFAPDRPDDDGLCQLRASVARVLADGRPDKLPLVRCRMPQPSARGVVLTDCCLSATNTPVRDAAGRVVAVLHHAVDVTNLTPLDQHTPAAADELQADVLHQAQTVQDVNRALEAERAHLRRLFAQAPGFMCFMRGPEHVFELANDAYYRISGHRRLIGLPIRKAFPDLEGQGVFEILDEVYRSGRPFVARELRIVLQKERGGARQELYLDFVYQPIIEADGTVSGIFVQGTNVTLQKQAQDELQRYRTQLEDLVLERTRALEQSEAALRHAQKMEAVGRLTGGVAHDFNNLLQVIGGNLQLLQRNPALGGTTIQRRLQAAAGAVERGAKLASQLLAFARRQPLAPAVVDLDVLLRGMDDLLRRVLGEEIEIRTEVAPDLWRTYADPSQIENVILNLVINARDAMDGRGRLTIETANTTLDAQMPDLAPGEYVMLAVSDTGCGMPPEVLEQACEPFFTTKPEGQGTGLGLSMVYGFVKQSGGHITLASTVGEGTTIRIYLPRALSDEAVEPERLTGPAEGGSETILVVEDDEAVRRTVVDLLTDLGYRVLQAPDGAAALAVIQRGTPIDLLFTDVVMPGPVPSTELARQAKAALPDLQVLFTSGYTDDALIQGGRLEPGVSLLSKPYGYDDLARKIRHLLRNGQQAAVTRRALEEAAGGERRPAAADKRTLDILLVEDDEFVRTALEELLAYSGHRIVCVGSGEEARERLAERSFDALFTDVGLPGISGTELAAEALRRNPAMRVVIASGYGRSLPTPVSHLLEEAIFLPKPYDVADVERIFEELAAEEPAEA